MTGSNRHDRKTAIWDIGSDSGEITHDRNENELGLKRGFRLLSSYRTSSGETKVRVITEADRSVTTVLLPEEY